MTNKSVTTDLGERTTPVAEEAFARLKACGAPPTPRAFEIWFTIISGRHPALAEALTALLDSKGSLSSHDFDALYDAHIAPRSFASHAERTSNGVIAEIDQVMEMIDLALGSSARYGESLIELSADLSGPIDRNQVRDIVGALVLATREAAATNRTLEARLNETRSEITSLRENLEAVRIEALTDPITGLANRRHFEEMLGKSIDHAAITHTPLSVIMIDIDHFSRFNETFGHATGNQILRLVSATTRDKVRNKATIARFGGEEFAVMLPDTPIETARDLAELVRMSIQSRELIKRSTGDSLGRVTISCGVAKLTRGDTLATLLERSDQCLLLAKGRGRNRTVSDADMISVEPQLGWDLSVA